MTANVFWHAMTLLIGVSVVAYALLAKEFRRARLFTAGERAKFEPTWFDRAWLIAFGMYFFIVGVLFFLRVKK
jgi:hypothetical protein